jgi:hypothetical protein
MGDIRPEDVVSHDAHPGSGASTTELTVTDGRRDWSGDTQSLTPLTFDCLPGSGLQNSNSATRVGENDSPPNLPPPPNFIEG